MTLDEMECKARAVHDDGSEWTRRPHHRHHEQDEVGDVSCNHDDIADAIDALRAGPGEGKL